MIEVKDLEKRYGSNQALKGISFTIQKGEIVGLLGPNGAGKSTTMNIVTGYISPSAGTVSIDGFDIMENPDEAKKRLGYLPEIPPLYTDMTVKEYLGFVYDLKKVKFAKNAHIEDICSLVKISHVKDRLIKNLSKGYRQRVGIAQALVGNPDVLILDEPTVGLDPNQIIEIRNLIQRLGKNHTVIVSSHILSEIQAVCERIIIIKDGAIIADDSAAGLAEKYSGDKRLIVSVRGSASVAEKAFSGVSGVVSVTKDSEIGADTVFAIEQDGNEDVAADIFRAAADAGLVLTQMRSNKLTLEEVFIKLTERTAQVEKSDEDIDLAEIGKEEK